MPLTDPAQFFLRVPELDYVTPQATGARRIIRPIHRHTDLTELLYVYRGEGTYTCGGYAYPICPGDFLLYNQGEMHEVRSASELEIGTYCFGVTGLHLDGLAPGQMTAPERGFVRPARDRAPDMDALCRTIYGLITQNDAYSRTAAQQLFLGLLLIALRCEPDARIREHIMLHYTEPLTLADIADALQISPYYASHVFKQETGMSPIQFMIDCRIGAAQSLLIASDFSAAQIGVMVGWDGINHFNAIFRKHVGMPPIQYRKHYLEHMRGRRRQ